MLRHPFFSKENVELGVLLQQRGYCHISRCCDASSWTWGETRDEKAGDPPGFFTNVLGLTKLFDTGQIG